MKYIKTGIDTAMIILLPLLMAYSLIGETAHEWLGLLMFLLFILHHSMNPAWLRMLFKGRYTPLRIYITGINFLLLIVMFLQPISGILLSKHIFHFSGFGGISLARTVHLLLAYWGFILMSVHVGNHRLWVRKKTKDTLWWALAEPSKISPSALVPARESAGYTVEEIACPVHGAAIRLLLPNPWRRRESLYPIILGTERGSSTSMS